MLLSFSEWDISKVVPSLSCVFAAVPSCHTGPTRPTVYSYTIYSTISSITQYGDASRSRSTTSFFSTNATVSVAASAAWARCTILISSTKHAYDIKHGTTSVKCSRPGSSISVIIYCKRYANLFLTLTQKYYFGIILFVLFMFSMHHLLLACPRQASACLPSFNLPPKCLHLEVNCGCTQVKVLPLLHHCSKEACNPSPPLQLYQWVFLSHFSFTLNPLSAICNNCWCYLEFRAYLSY